MQPITEVKDILERLTTLERSINDIKTQMDQLIRYKPPFFAPITSTKVDFNTNDYKLKLLKP